MFAANTYRIRLATDRDADDLRHLAELDLQPPLVGRRLLGEIGGAPAAALSLDDVRVIADPRRHTAYLVANLRVRANALRAYETTPSLATRMIAALPAAVRPAPRHDTAGSWRSPTLVNGHAGERRLQPALAGCV